MKTISPAAGKHLLCLTSIFVLTGFALKISSEKSKNCLSEALKMSFRSGCAALRDASDSHLREVIYYYTAYPIESKRDNFDEAKQIHATADSIYFQLENWQINRDAEQLKSIGYQTQRFRLKFAEMIHWDTSYMKKVPVFSKLHDGGWWLFHAYQKYSLSQFDLILEQTKFKTALIEELGLNQSSYRASASMCGIIYYDLRNLTHPLNPSVGDTIINEVVFREIHVKKLPTRFEINGQNFPLGNGKHIFETGFELKFDKPGKHPLHCKVELLDPATDSISIWEKTYFLNVKK